MAVTRERSPSGDKIQEWLESNPADPVPLIMWLQGKRMPPVDPGTEPHQYLQQWLSGGHRLDMERDRLAPLLAAILGSIRADKLLEKINHPGEFIYNLGMFCAFVSRPAVLAEPLRALIDSLGEGDDWGVLQKKALRLAVQHNDDGQFKAMWREMAEGRHHPFFGTNIRDAIRGLMWSPGSVNGLGHEGMPDWSVLGPAFCGYARQLESGDYDRRLEFRQLVLEAEQIFLAMPRDRWSAALLDTAEQYEWPRWALETLPSLLVKIDNNTYRVWKPCVSLFESILELRARNDHEVAQGNNVLGDAMTLLREGDWIVTVTISDQARTTFLAIAGHLEARRLQLKVWNGPSVDAALGALKRDFLEAYETELNQMPRRSATTCMYSQDIFSKTLARSQRSYPISLARPRSVVTDKVNELQAAGI